MFSTANPKTILLIVALSMYPNYVSAMEHPKEAATLISCPLPDILPQELIEKITVGIIDNSTNIEEALCSLIYFKTTDRTTHASVAGSFKSPAHVATVVEKLSKLCAKDYRSYSYPPKALAHYFISKTMNISIPNPDSAENITPEDLFRKAYNAGHKKISTLFFLQSTNQEAKNYFFYDCVQKDDVDTAQFCLKHGADVNTVLKSPLSHIVSGMTPLLHAVLYRKLDMIKALLPFKPNQKLTIKRKWGIGGNFIVEQESIIQYAAGNAAIKELLEPHNKANA